MDLFAGIGGFHAGIDAAAARRNRAVKTLLVSESDPSCQETYELNYKCDVEGDINKISLAGFNRRADIVTAGFPCQPFSNSGLKLGLSDSRGQFYFRIAKIIKAFDAKSFILENVSGLRTNGGGDHTSRLAFPALPEQVIGESMKSLEDNLRKLKNYHVRWQEIDSSHFGSPQVRKRIYIIGVHKDFTKVLDWEFQRYEFNSFLSVEEENPTGSLKLSPTQEANLRSFMNEPPSYHKGMRRVGQVYKCRGGNVGQGYHAHGLVPTLTKVWARLLPIYFPHRKENNPNINTREFEPNKYYGEGSFRRASVREVMRLQGFPDSFIPHSKSNRAYEHAGNAVNAKVVRDIAEIILEKIDM